MDKKFILTGFGYAIVGLALRIYMGITGNHGQLMTHAHIMLLGLVVSFIYGVCHKLWLDGLVSKLKSIQFYLHQIGIAFFTLGLFLLYAGIFERATLKPVLAISSLMIFAGMILMKVLFIKASK